MFGVIIWSLFGILVIRLGVKGFFFGDLQFLGTTYSGKKGKILSFLLLIIGVACFAFAFYRLLFFIPK
jgi:hypothetical protein